MTDANAAAPAAKVPWWFWLVCVLALLWNGFGAYDFAMSIIQGDAYYLSGAPETAQGMEAMHAAIFAGCVFFIWFSWFATRKGFLR